MRRLVLIILALATLLPSLAHAYDILVVQSSRNAGYETVLKNFQASTKASQRVIVLTDYAEVDTAGIVREDRPRLILAIGDAAIKATGKIQRTPQIAVMSLEAASKPNITGITVFAPPARYCELFNQMRVQRVGIIHNPDKTGWYLEKVRKAAEKAGIWLEVRSVKTPKEVLAKLDSLAGKVDALWMLPDTTAVTRETTEAYFHFGQNHAVPIISFASSYLGLGAAAVIEMDLPAIGRQAGNMAAALLGGAIIGTMPFEGPSRTDIKTNHTILKKLSLDFMLSE